MRQGEALKKEEDEKLKKRQLEDSSRWTLRKIPKNSFSSIGIKSQETTNTPKKIVLETASFEDIYGQDSKKTNSSQQGRRAFGNFEKTVSYFVIFFSLFGNNLIIYFRHRMKVKKQLKKIYGIRTKTLTSTIFWIEQIKTTKREKVHNR